MNKVVFEVISMKIKPIIICTLLFTLFIASCSSTTASPNSLAQVLPATSAAVQTTNTVQTPTAAEWSPDGIINAGEYSGSHQYGVYSVYWRSDGQFIYLGITARTSGWVAMALQSASGMKGADMVLGFVKDGKTEIQDRFCTDNLGTHPADTELGGANNILASGGKEEGGVTSLEFKRALNTGDKYDISIKAGVNQILWSYGNSDNLELKHADRGYGQIIQ
jgi:hypothetical protein